VEQHRRAGGEEIVYGWVRLGGSIEDRDRRPGIGESPGVLAAEPSVSTGDDGDLAVETEKFDGGY